MLRGGRADAAEMVGARRGQRRPGRLATAAAARARPDAPGSAGRCVAWPPAAARRAHAPRASGSASAGRARRPAISLCAHGRNRRGAVGRCRRSAPRARSADGRGRPLAAKISRPPRRCRRRAPRPYTVSVGNATSSPASSARAAACDRGRVSAVAGSSRPVTPRCRARRRAAAAPAPASQRRRDER